MGCGGEQQKQQHFFVVTRTDGTLPQFFLHLIGEPLQFLHISREPRDGTAQRSSDSARRLFWLTQIHRDSNANASHLLSPYFWAITLDNKLAKKKEKKKARKKVPAHFLLLFFSFVLDCAQLQKPSLACVPSTATTPQ